MGLGLIFLGMTIMKEVLDPIKTSSSVKAFFAGFSSSLLLGIMAGTLPSMRPSSFSATCLRTFHCGSPCCCIR
ncbi:MAG: hypothetical protein JXA64_04390 [Candidatus Fermentibacteraceae bacterium]|nr:hypothetical protein [Candidatus Fermentibacteraceae bacterium]MBN2608332.1 hypothetical protein [Candidatus Fermentibacteraceae bacterium]